MSAGADPGGRHWTEAYVGLPYEQGGGPSATLPSASLGTGRASDRGFNCWTFFRHVQLERFGIRVPAIAEPESRFKLLRKVPAAAVELGWERVDPPRTGDAVLMAHWKHPSHVGLWVDEVNGGAVLHCVAGAGAVLATPAHLEMGQWRIISFFRPCDMPAATLEVPGHG